MKPSSRRCAGREAEPLNQETAACHARVRVNTRKDTLGNTCCRRIRRTLSTAPTPSLLNFFFPASVACADDAQGDLWTPFTKWDQCLETLVVACGGTSSRSYRPNEELDNTKHTSGCSLAATPGILGVLLVLCVVKSLLCPSRRRALYAGSEDAPELEEIVSSDGSRHGRRVDSYATRHGRLTTGTIGGSGSGVDRSSSSSSRAPRPKSRARP